VFARLQRASTHNDVALPLTVSEINFPLIASFGAAAGGFTPGTVIVVAPYAAAAPTTSPAIVPPMKVLLDTPDFASCVASFFSSLILFFSYFAI
jgi:hypothetical protein